MNKVELKWDFKTEEKLFKIFRKLNYSKLNHKTLKMPFEEILKTFMNFSINLEKKYHKTKNIDVKKHLTLATRQLNEITEWQQKMKEFVAENKDNTDLRKKLKNNAKFRARNMKGNYYKDFLEEMVAEDSEYFAWNTMGDERVRPEHEDRDGEIYKWNNADLLPGEDPGCRCWATAYFPDDWEKRFID